MITVTGLVLPKAGRGHGRALGQGFEFHPDDIAIHLQAPGEGAEAAIDTGDDVFAADDLGILDDAVGDKLGMFDEIGCRIDDAGNNHLAVGKFDVAPDLPFMPVARIGAGKGQRRRNDGNVIKMLVGS